MSQSIPYKTLSPEDENYPNLLLETPDPPQKLYLLGDISTDTPWVAIVGTRKASKEGQKMAEVFAKELSSYGVGIVSGLALGIDTCAHKGALDAGGKTIAVLGSAIDRVYPATNEKLAKKIIETGGAVVSEYEPGAQTQKYNFIHRNRIISGLSLAILVIEAPEHSGALVTARYGAEQGRYVFVVPGSPRDINYRGSNALIRDGAILVQSPEQILEDLGINLSQKVQGQLREEVVFSEGEEILVETLRIMGKPLKVDTIVQVTKLEPHVVSAALTSLIIKGLIIESGTQYILNEQ